MLLNAGLSGLDEEKGVGGMIFAGDPRQKSAEKRLLTPYNPTRRQFVNTL
jgi:hypothetical protein